MNPARAELMARVTANGVQLEVDTIGDPLKPSVMLIMGLGMQLTAWPDELCRILVSSGFHVIRFDNRDVGLSERIKSKSPVNISMATLRYLFRLPVPAPYLIDTMADDAIGVLDALGIGAAHLIGASLGGMIAQSAAARYPDRCLSLTSIMSSSGARSLPRASLKVSRVLFSRPPARANLDLQIEHFVRVFQVIGSPDFPVPPAQLRERMRLGLQRSYDPAATQRQLLAIIASGDRSPQLRKISAPTLVLHGDKDPLVPVKHGMDCARKIPGATLRVIHGMGHDLPPALLPTLSAEMIAHLRRSSRLGPHTAC